LIPFLLIAASILPHDTVLREHSAETELNVLYDEHGREVFTQSIFRNTDHSIRAWRLVKLTYQVPARDWLRGGYVATWMDGEQLRQVWCDNVQWTWTQWDRELVEREVLAKEKRRELRRAK